MFIIIINYYHSKIYKKLEKIAAERGVKLYLASDVVVADKFAADAANQIVDINNIPADWMGLDVGPKTIADIQEGLSDCKTVIWNGPMGVFEFDAFAKGTNAIATTLAKLTSKGCITIIGGGDSVAAVEKAGLATRMSHISTGGGASLGKNEYIINIIIYIIIIYIINIILELLEGQVSVKIY